ncbi:MAG TPA: phosphate-starvation-inducible PsiE family protein [Aggregatilineales bacterium]|nr:phosphate-starvation-inducible PsiE family protein [Aggregatilineales bacterium]
MSQSHSDHSSAEPRSWVVHYLGRAERIVLSLIAFVLVVLAVLLLVSQVIAMIQAVLNGSIRDAAIEILDGVLLVMMTMEIVYTVTLSLQSHKLIAEPFLIIGVIAAIRRMLVITAESTHLEQNADQGPFRSLLLELGLLAVIVGVLAFAIATMRRSESLVPDDETKLEDD